MPFNTLHTPLAFPFLSVVLKYYYYASLLPELLHLSQHNGGPAVNVTKLEISFYPLKCTCLKIKSVKLIKLKMKKKIY